MFKHTRQTIAEKESYVRFSRNFTATSHNELQDLELKNDCRLIPVEDTLEKRFVDWDDNSVNMKLYKLIQILIGRNHNNLKSYT